MWQMNNCTHMYPRTNLVAEKYVSLSVRPSIQTGCSGSNRDLRCCLGESRLSISTGPAHSCVVAVSVCFTVSSGHPPS